MNNAPVQIENPDKHRFMEIPGRAACGICGHLRSEDCHRVPAKPRRF